MHTPSNNGGSVPVRKIPKSHVSVTGLHATTKSLYHAEFESPLENDYLTLLDFDPAVHSYEVQPVRVPVPGVPKGYVPDVLVHFQEDADGRTRASELTEVKSEDDFRANAAKYAPKFAAAVAYCTERNWLFVKKTEKDIRSPFLANIKFLRRYGRITPDPADLLTLLRTLARADGHSSSTRLLDTLAPDADTRARLLTALWHLVATNQVEVDLQTAFGGDVPLWLEGARP